MSWLWVAIAVLLFPEWASACSVCAGSDEESKSAFIWTTVLLSVLPPGMVGGLVWWLWRLHRERDAASAAAALTEPVAPSQP